MNKLALSGNHITNLQQSINLRDSINSAGLESKLNYQLSDSDEDVLAMDQSKVSIVKKTNLNSSSPLNKTKSPVGKGVDPERLKLNFNFTNEFD